MAGSLRLLPYLYRLLGFVGSHFLPSSRNERRYYDGSLSRIRVNLATFRTPTENRTRLSSLEDSSLHPAARARAVFSGKERSSFSPDGPQEPIPAFPIGFEPIASTFGGLRSSIELREHLRTPDRIRTCTLRIRSATLIQLSYRSKNTAQS